MNTQEAPNLPILSMSLDDLARSTGIGRTNVFNAAACGELKTFQPVIKGKVIKRRLVTPAAGAEWINQLAEA